MSLDVFISGRYSSQYNSNDVGITENGYELSFETMHETINESDAYGQTILDSIWRGGNVTCDFTSLAAKTGSLVAFWPYGGSITAPTAGTLGVLVDPTVAAPNKLPIGQLASNIAKPFGMTVAAGTPANNVGAPGGLQTITANYALLRENFPAKLLFSSKLKKVPVSLRFYPYDGAVALLGTF
jgi:hypothetical protein